MKKKLTLLALLLIFSNAILSQSYIGFLNDNYSGVNGIISNPANIVDSRLKTDINLIGFSGLIDNDYLAVKLSDLTNTNFDFDKSGEKFPLNNNNATVNLDILGPSFMLNIKPKHSIALSTRVRGILNANDINGTTLNLIGTDFNQNKDYKINEGDANAAFNGWGEVGLTYATVFLDKKVHFLKGGITLKYLQGLGNSNGDGRNISIDYKKMELL